MKFGLIRNVVLSCSGWIFAVLAVVPVAFIAGAQLGYVYARKCSWIADTFLILAIAATAASVFFAGYKVFRLCRDGFLVRAAVGFITYAAVFAAASFALARLTLR